MNYDEYEQDLLDHEEELLKNAKPPTPEEKKLLQEAARNTLNKDKRINICISSRDLGSLQRLANRYGMPYQTLISSVLHRYVSGDLQESGFERDASGTPDKPGS